MEDREKMLIWLISRNWFPEFVKELKQPCQRYSAWDFQDVFYSMWNGALIDHSLCWAKTYRYKNGDTQFWSERNDEYNDYRRKLSSSH